jgi:hypothetical protein
LTAPHPTRIIESTPSPGGRNRLEIIMTATTITTADAAAELNTTPRELRKFLRSDASKVESVGKGSRYALPANAKAMTALRKRFDAWRALADAHDATPDA